MLFTLHPPHPLITKLPPEWGETRRAGGGAIDFHDAGRQGESEKHVDSTPCNLVSIGSTKATARSATFAIPRFLLFFPRVVMFFPHDVFWHRGPFFFISSSFKRRERGGEGWKARSGESTGLNPCLKKHPRVLPPIHGFSVDGFLSKTQCWRGFTGDRGPIHASTGRNAPVPHGGGS